MSNKNLEDMFCRFPTCIRQCKVLHALGEQGPGEGGKRGAGHWGVARGPKGEAKGDDNEHDPGDDKHAKARGHRCGGPVRKLNIRIKEKTILKTGKKERKEARKEGGTKSGRKKAKCAFGTDWGWGDEQADALVHERASRRTCA